MNNRGKSNFNCSGFALPATIAIIFVIAAITLALVIKGMEVGKMGRRSSNSQTQQQVADQINGRMQEVIASLPTPDPAKLSAAGLPGIPPAPGKGSMDFKGTIGDSKFYGSFNRGDPWSTAVAIPTRINSQTFSFGTLESTAYMSSKYPLPTNHSRIFYTVETPGNAPATYFCTFSNNSPYGITTPRGSIFLYSADSVMNPSPGLQELGENYYLHAYNIINVNNSLTGTAQTYRTNGIGAVKVGNCSSGKIQHEVAQLPSLERNNITNAVESLYADVGKNAYDPGFIGFARALWDAKTAKYEEWPLVDLSGFCASGDYGSLVWTESVMIPSNGIILIPLNIEIYGDLQIKEGAIVYVTGDLKVNGHVFLCRDSVLKSDGELILTKPLELPFTPVECPGIGAAVLSRRGLTLPAGMRQATVNLDITNTLFPFMRTPNPFNPKTQLGKFNEFKKVQNEAFNKLMTASAPMQKFCAKTAPLLGPDTANVPGTYIFSRLGDVNITDNNQQAHAAGMFIANGSVNINFPKETKGTMTGTIYTLDGNANMPNAKYHYYPYYTAASVSTGNGKKSTINLLPRTHVVSSGRLK